MVKILHTQFTKQKDNVKNHLAFEAHFSFGSPRVIVKKAFHPQHVTVWCL